MVKVKTLKDQTLSSKVVNFQSDADGGRRAAHIEGLAPPPFYDMDDSAPFVCSLCGHPSNYEGLGDLFGPYHSDGHVRVGTAANKPSTVRSHSADSKRHAHQAATADRRHPVTSAAALSAAKTSSSSRSKSAPSGHVSSASIAEAARKLLTGGSPKLSVSLSRLNPDKLPSPVASPKSSGKLSTTAAPAAGASKVAGSRSQSLNRSSSKRNDAAQRRSRSADTMTSAQTVTVSRQKTVTVRVPSINSSPVRPAAASPTRVHTSPRMTSSPTAGAGDRPKVTICERDDDGWLKIAGQQSPVRL